MIIIDNTIVSDDIVKKQFVCNLNACKGACCEEGDAGAPLEMDELLVLDEIYDSVKPYLPQKNVDVIEKQGLYEVDQEGDFCTTTVDNRECVFALRNENGTLACAIEKAYLDGKTAFKKPISCHLYPIRVTKTAVNEILNYHKWEICSEACTLGENLKVPVYKFLKEPLERKFGKEWFAILEQAAKL